MINPAGVLNAAVEIFRWIISFEKRDLLVALDEESGDHYQDISVWTTVVDSTTYFMYTSKQPVLLLVLREKNGKRRIKRMK